MLPQCFPCLSLKPTISVQNHCFKSGSSHRQSCRLIPVCSVRARWSIDIRYGMKMDAVALLQEWVRDVGSKAGLSSSNTRLSSGAVGIPESRLELEVEFDSFAQLEGFWGSIPPVEHKAWSQRVQNIIIDGSPRWEVVRSVPVLQETDAAASSDEQPSVSTPGFSFPFAIVEPKPQAVPPPPLGKNVRSSEGGVALVDGADADVVLDWKGDPMVINPGDKLGGLF
eukprot:jgi/Botrbrau1/16743/Bobra.0277s0001.1